MGKICGSGMENRNRYSGTGTIFGDGQSVFVLYCFWNFCIFLCILFNCAFNGFYKVNHGLEVPRETRLEKLMRLLEVLKKMHGGKAELSTKTILGMHF